MRLWVMDKARVLAVVGIHGNTFKPFTGTKTSVLFLQKWKDNEEAIKDYPIFLAVNENSVKDNSGNYIYKKNPDGSPFIVETKDTHGFIHHKQVVDDDLDEIANGFVEFAREQKFDFWK